MPTFPWFIHFVKLNGEVVCALRHKAHSSSISGKETTLRYQSFRTVLVSMLLVSLTMLLSVSPVGAATLSSHTATHPTAVHQFSPNGHGFALPHQLSTSTTPQVKGTGHGSVPARPAPGGRKNVPSPKNVVRVPVPGSNNISIKTSINGMSNTGWAPSDSNGAGGLANYFETVNEQFTVYTRAGAVQYSNNFNTWFGQSGSLFDPKVVWDNLGKRFIFEVDTGSALLISVAQQANGVGNYCNYSFSTLSGYFADYDQLGVDSNGIYFSANMYPNSGSVISEVFFATRSSMETCQGTGYSYYYGLTNADGSGYSFTIVPAVEHTNSGVNTEYMVNTNGPGGGCSLTLWWLESNGTLLNFNINTQCYSPPPPAVQAGSSGTIETLDNRLYQAAYRNGVLSLDTVGSHDWGDGNGQVGIVEWFQINASAATLKNQGNFGTPGYWNFFPAMDVTSQGKMLFVYNSSGPSIYPSVWAVSGCLCDTVVVASGVSYYGTSGTSRWGDYQSAWLDPTANRTGQLTSIWVTGQYADATNGWGTQAARLIPHS